MTETTVDTRHTIRVINGEGDLQLSWDVENETDVNLAREAFAKAKSNGYLAYSVTEDADGNKFNEVIKEFDADAQVIVMTPQLVGG